MENNMRYAIDEIINDIVILEDIETGEPKEVKISQLPNNIHDGNILIYENDEYKLDIQYEIERRQLLQEKLNKIKN